MLVTAIARSIFELSNHPSTSVCFLFFIFFIYDILITLILKPVSSWTCPNLNKMSTWEENTVRKMMFTLIFLFFHTPGTQPLLCQADVQKHDCFLSSGVPHLDLFTLAKHQTH